ncbi:hypothetical protein Q9L58_000676 [Maublancomyces gigas]|uniref:Uncharacterized protein n=1 Tax=Discina gigas TaxID=1032678 RepID=A0ABR3GWU7_9PEZI
MPPEEVIENYHLRHWSEDADNFLYESPQLSHIQYYQSARYSHIMLNERTVEARGKEMSELFDRVDAEQLLKKQLDELLEQGIPDAEMHQIIERLQLDPITDTPRSRITDSQLVTPRTVTVGRASDEGSTVPTLPTGMEGPLSQGTESPQPIMQFREKVKAYFISGGWTEEDFNHLVGDPALRELTSDGQVESETEMLRRLIALALGEQVHDIIPETVENTGLGPILDNECPFHVVRAYIDRHSKKHRKGRNSGRCS